MVYLKQCEPDNVLRGKKIGIIGVGNIGSAIIRGIVGAKGKVSPQDIAASDIDKKKLHAISYELSVGSASDNVELISCSDIIILAIKPSQVKEVLEEIPRIDSGKLVISVAAGIKTSFIEKMLPVAVVRAMPNMASLLGEGMTAISAGKLAKERELEFAEAIFSTMGETIRVEENLMDIVTAVSGSGPAYFFLMMEALIEAGVAGGLSSQVAHQLVMQTAYGAIRMAKESGKELSLLRDEITSPGGTTEAGISILEKRQFKNILIEAVAAGAAKSKELSKNE